MQMLAATLKVVVDRFGLQGQRVGEVAAGAVLKHSRDANLGREALLDSGLSPQTPGSCGSRPCRSPTMNSYLCA